MSKKVCAEVTADLDIRIKSHLDHIKKIRSYDKMKTIKAEAFRKINEIPLELKIVTHVYYPAIVKKVSLAKKILKLFSFCQ